MTNNWYIWPEHLTVEQVIKCYREMFGRDPEYIFKNSRFWWTEINVKA
ncbi:MAG TPA: hypothetical protein PK728_05915 [Bacillota bacterium]|nr:hypothetical protein [Bacillota bacterium]